MEHKIKTLGQVAELIEASMKEIEKLQKRYTKEGARRLRRNLDKLCNIKPELRKEMIAFEKSLPKKK